MLLLDRQSGATAQPRGEANHTGVSACRVQLRLRTNGQLFELLPGKTTIGSSPRCNVRIEQPGVQPLHCLIVDGPEGLRVRSWVANTALNGVPFDESALAVGDCLNLGPVELEVFEPLAGVQQPKAAQAPGVDVTDAGQVRTGRDQARARSRRLLDALRHERSTHHELCQQVLKLQESHLDAIAEQSETSGKLERSLAELAEARRQLGEFQAVETARQQLADRNEQLGFEIGELSAQINELTQGHAELAKSRRQFADDHAALELQHTQLIEAHTKLQGEIAQAASKKAAVHDQNQQLAEQNAQLRSELDRIANENKTLREESPHFGEINSRLQSDVARLAKEKAAADEHNRSLVQQQLQLQREAGHLAEQKAQLEDEREGLRRQNEQLLSEARECSVERGSLTDERASLCQERSELRQQNELLRARITQLDDENSAMAVGKLALVEQCDSLSSEAERLQLKVAELSKENVTLAAAKATLADEQAQLQAEQKRLAELEREMGAAVSGRENTSAELYRALLQVAELQERDSQNQAVVEAYELLSKEHDQLHGEADQLKEQIARLSQERAAVESAWQGLSDEAVTLSESQQRLADENASLVTRLEEARQQRERGQQERSTLAGSANELERERAAKLQAEADIAAAIADGERRLEEQERRFAEQAKQFAEQSSQFNERSRQHAEAIQLLEQQLAAANESHDSLAQAREAARLQSANADSHCNEQSRRIQELESQLAAAEARAAKAAELAASQLAAEQAEKISQIANGQPTEFRWSSAGAGAASHDDLNPVAIDDATPDASLVDSTPGKAAWDRPASAANVWQSVGSERSACDFSSERTVAPWSNVSESAVTADEPSPRGEKVASPAPLDANTFGDDDDEESFQQASTPEKSSASRQEPVSFIERYSHLLAEDGAPSEEKPNRANDLANARPIVPVVARLEEVTSAPAKTEDEDSIEQYMAKLLQRVRGDSEGRKAAQEQPSQMPLNTPTAKPGERSTGFSESAAVGVPESRAEGDAEAVDVRPADRGELVKRRVSSPAPTTNLGALRALANETARLAISRHELRTLRRKAVTKTIVATLAGMTSLWLMLDSPDWRHIQFLTACGALLVAAYWAAEAFRTLLNSKRLAAFEGPEDTALPIDVEENS